MIAEIYIFPKTEWYLEQNTTFTLKIQFEEVLEVLNVIEMKVSKR